VELAGAGIVVTLDADHADAAASAAVAELGHHRRGAGREARARLLGGVAVEDQLLGAGEQRLDRRRRRGARKPHVQVGKDEDHVGIAAGIAAGAEV
jgi:hypothetical protein